MKPHSLRTAAFAIAASTTVALAACSGGGGGSSTPPVARATTAPVPGQSAPAATAGSASKLGIKYGGSTTTSSVHTKGFTAGSAVVVTYNGAIVGTGQLDGNGFVEISFTQSVPAGATVVATIGSGNSAIVSSIVLATSISATASLVTYNAGPPPTVKVMSAADASGNGQYSATASDNEEEDENPQNGAGYYVVSPQYQVLPQNLPITVTACSTSFTIALNPNAMPPLSGSYALQVLEKANESDNMGVVDYFVTPFTSPQTFYPVSAASRLQIDLFQNGLKVLEVRAPLSAFTSASTTPSSCPTQSPSLSPSSTPYPYMSSPPYYASPSPYPSSSPYASPYPSSSPYASPYPSSSPSASPYPSSSPYASPYPSSSPSASPYPSSSPTTGGGGY